MLPLIEEITPCPEVMDVLQAFADHPDVVLFDSAQHDNDLGRYSFLSAAPLRFYELGYPQYGLDPFGEIKADCVTWQLPSTANLPPFQGGIAGLLSYDLGRCWENLPVASNDEFGLPALAAGFYDWVIAWDHRQDRAWIIAHGCNFNTLRRSAELATERMHAVKQTLQTSTSEKKVPVQSALSSSKRKLVAQWLAPGPAGTTSNFSREDYLLAVEKVIDYIFAGDIFQANLSQRLVYPLQCEPLALYEKLRQRNAAPFAGYFAHDDWQVLTASPERFLEVRNQLVTSRPIKGTRRREPGIEADLFKRDELRESEKDQAENVMIVDLLRNDLSRVCRPGSIRVPQLCAVETFATVQHLVSAIQGQLLPDVDVWDLFAATFPGGSITGAPKIRAMEIIAELEPTSRGYYCGSLFYTGFDGTVDSNILIRTFTCRHGWAQFPVGGGIIAQSNAVDEYEETLHKAEGLFRALRP